MSSPGMPYGQGVYSSVPDYDYSSYVKTPESMGANSGASWDSFQNNLKIGTKFGLSLMTNNFSVNKTGGPLGMDYLLNTNTLCNAIDICGNDTDPSGNPKVPRYTYIQTVTPNTGIIGSMISDIEKGFNPNNLELSFTPSIDCQKVSLYTRDQNNNVGIGSAWVAKKEIQSINPCYFSNRINTVTGEKCSESFENYSDSKYDKYMIYSNKKEKDIVESVYLTGLMVFGLYLVYCFMKKTN
jgi:hypothetical protein